MHQEPSYAEYAYSHGLIPLAAKQKLERQWIECLDRLQQSSRPLTYQAFGDCNLLQDVLAAAGQPNEYNTATFIGYDQIIKPAGPFNSFFQDPEIQSALHMRGYDLPGLNFMPEHWQNISSFRGPAPLSSSAAPTEMGFYYEPPFGWAVCNDAIDEEMGRDHPTSAVPTLQFLVDFSQHQPNGFDPRHISTRTASKDVFINKMKQVEGHIRILMYSGEFDLNTNFLGTLHTLEANYWRKRAWATAERALWKYNNEVAGEYFSIDDVFSFLIVRNSGELTLCL